jgi:hypothetical protein
MQYCLSMPRIVRAIKLSNVAFDRRLRAMLHIHSSHEFVPHQVHCPMRAMEVA